MKKSIKILLCSAFSGLATFAFSGSAYAQQSFGGQPLSFTTAETSTRSADGMPEQAVRTIPFTENVDDILAQTSWGTLTRARPYIVGKVMTADYDFARDANIVALGGGKTVYRLALSSPEAKGLSVTYSDFYIPQGGKLYIYGKNRADLLGAYTNATHPEGGAFSTEPISGSEVVLEYEPGADGALPRIKVDGLVYLFRNIDPMTTNPGEDNSDPSCQIGANCPQGDNWDDQKAGIVQMYMIFGSAFNGYAGICSGDLMNNTNGDYKGYILSAAHCAANDNGAFSATDANMAKWIFSFHYEKPTCSNGDLAVTRGISWVGCKKKAFLSIKGKSDGLLLETLKPVPAEYRVFYNGWDNRSTTPARVVGLHHPAGDAMKISVRNSAPKIGTWDGVPAGDTNAHFVFSFDEGDTEGGSSGSSLFNQDKRVVGTLTGGGGAKCTQSARDLYGRLHYHWAKYKDQGDDQRMDIYLDPKGKGSAETLNGTYRDNMKPLYPVTRIEAFPTPDLSKIEIAWNAPRRIANANGAEVVYELFRDGNRIAEVKGNNASGYKYTDEKGETPVSHGMITYSVRARYKVTPEDIVTPFVSTAVYLGELIKTVLPKSVEAKEFGGKKQTMIMWNTPAYYQEIAQFDYKDNYTYSKYPSFYQPKVQGQSSVQEFVKYREKWAIGNAPKEIGGQGVKLYVTQVNVVPTVGNDPGYISLGTDSRLGASTVWQKIEKPAGWQAGQWVSVVLTKPLELNPDQMLYVGFGGENKSSNLPAISLVDGTANAISPYTTGQFLLADIYSQGSVSDEWLFIKEATYVKFSDDYMAIRLIVSNAKEKPEAPVANVMFGGKQIAAFPIVKEYVLKHNGVEIARQKNTYYQDQNNPDASGEYTIDVVYQDPSGAVSTENIASPQTVEAYPSVFSDRVNIRHAARAQAAKLFDMEGRLVGSWSVLREDAALDLAHLPSGAYIMRFETSEGSVVQKLVKK